MLDDATIKAIESVLAKDDRAEVIPVKGKIKVVRIRREEVKKVSSNFGGDVL